MQFTSEVRKICEAKAAELYNTSLVTQNEWVRVSLLNTAGMLDTLSWGVAFGGDLRDDTIILLSEMMQKEGVEWK